jgi:hypothetical protein
MYLEVELCCGVVSLRENDNFVQTKSRKEKEKTNVQKNQKNQQPT